MNIFKEAASKENKTLNTVFGSIAIGLLIVASYLTFHNTPLQTVSAGGRQTLLMKKINITLY